MTDSRFVELLSLLDKVNNILKDIDCYQKECSDKCSEYDKQLVDIQHCLELEKLSASQMMQIVSKQKSILLERRIVKDELDYMYAIFSVEKNTQSYLGKLWSVRNALSKQRDEILTRKYTPRSSLKLFSEENIRERKEKPLTYTDYKGRKRTVKSKKQTSLDAAFALIEEQKNKQKSK